MAIAAVNASSSTASNWLKEAQESIAASESPGGLMGMLQDARSGYSLKTFIAKSQNNSYALAQIAQSGQQSAGQLAVQMSQAAAAKRYNEQVELQVKLNPVHQNYNAPRELDPVIYFDDGASIDTTNNIMTMANGTQIDTTTGLKYTAPGSIISMANGAYLDTMNNILTMPDGTKVDTITGLTITV
jgi:hypothetical protein